MSRDPLASLGESDPQHPQRTTFADGPLDERALRELLALQQKAPSRSSSPGPRLTTPRVLLGTLPLVAAAAAVAVAVVISIAGVPSSTRENVRDRAGNVAVVKVTPADASAGPTALDRIATVAATRPLAIPGDQQFVYVRSIGGGLDLTDRKAPVFVDDGERRAWIPQADGVTGLITDRSGSTPWNPALGGDQRLGSYSALAALPHEPDALLAQVRAQETELLGTGQTASDAEVFQALGGLLLDGLAPSALSAAVYRAAALVPGVSTVPGAVDAAGRHGLGLAVDDEASGVRYEWVVDSSTSTFLGSRAYLTRNTSWAAAGTLVSEYAVLDRAVVDRAGQVPRNDQLLR